MLSLSVSLPNSWERLADDYVKLHNPTARPSTKHNYRAQLRLFLAWIEQQAIPLESFRGRDMLRYIEHRCTTGGTDGAGCSEQTVRKDAIIIRQMFRFAKTHDYIERDPLTDYKVPKADMKEQPLLEDEEVRRLLRAVGERWNVAKNPDMRFQTARARRFYRVRDMAILTGLMDTACRVGEMLALRWEDIDTDKRKFYIAKSKSRKDRWVPFSEEWLAYVMEWRKVRAKSDSDILFVSIYGEPMDVGHFSKSFRAYRDFAELPEKYHLHSLRHYALTALAETDLKGAQDIAGHADPKTTRRYAHPREEHNKAVHDTAAPLGRILAKSVMVNKRSEQQRIQTRRKRLA